MNETHPEYDPNPKDNQKTISMKFQNDPRGLVQSQVENHRFNSELTLI